MALIPPSTRAGVSAGVLASVSAGVRARAAALLALASVWPLLCGFNLIGNGKHVLEAAADGTVTFALGPEAPVISDRESYEEGRYADLSDATLWARVVELSLAKWNEVPGTSVRLVARTDPSAAVDETDKKHSILLSRELPFSVAASALPIKDDESGFIRDCDIQVGAGPTPLEELLVTVTHELGHCLGLGHNHVDYGALMGYSALERTFRLGADDKAGLIYLYPATTTDKSGDNAFAPCGSVAAVGGLSRPGGGRRAATDASLPWALLSLPLLGASCYHVGRLKRRP